MKSYAITFDVTVLDEDDLYRTAKEHFDDAQYNDDDNDADDFLKHPDGRIDVEACLIELFDPGVSPKGCQIEGSSVQGTYSSSLD